jgi:hypothetical protein
MKKIILFFTICLYCVHFMQASIRILATTPASATCEGSISIEASGTAGPFRLHISNGSGYDLSKAMSGSTETITGLCAGQYTVEVINTFGCAKALSAQVSSASGSLDLVPQRAARSTALALGTLQARAYPNPFSTDFQVELDWDGSRGEPIHLEVLNALGQLVHSQRLEAARGRNRFRVELRDPASRGLLQVVLRDEQGRQVVLKVMQVRE